MRPRNRGMGCRWYGARGPYSRSVMDLDADTLSAAEYIGPCRCGTGPNAFYRTHDGRVIHAAETVTSGTTDVLTMRDEVRRLTEQVRALERRLADE